MAMILAGNTPNFTVSYDDSITIPNGDQASGLAFAQAVLANCENDLTTFSNLFGGIIRWITDGLRNRRNLNDAQKARVDNAGILTASGLIAGEALCGIAVAAVIARRLARDPHASTVLYDFKIGDHFVTSLIALAVLALVMIVVPLANAGRPEDPAPPTAIM